MGDKGRIVVPADVRARHNWTAGTPLVMVETPHGVLLTDRTSAREVVRRLLAGSDLVAELLSDRRAEAARDDAAPGR